MVGRRKLLQGAAGLAAGGLAGPLARPAIGAPASVLRFIPEADLAILDPVWTTANVTRNHAYMVYDTLYGLDDAYAVQPQMVAGHRVADDRLRWEITLREGLRFHDGSKVTAADVVPSIRRWATRNPFGQYLLAALNEMSAPDDRTVVLRLKHAFPVDRALANGAMVMPAALAGIDASRQVSEVIGSGPFRFLPGERDAGARIVYERFAGYLPRPEPTRFTAGSKQAFVDRVEWLVIPDGSTASIALQRGEADWWGSPAPDLVPVLRRAANLTVEVIDPSGAVGIMRFNHLQPPFNDPAVRRAVLPAIDQASFMTAVAGEDRSFWKTGVGAFSLESPLANTVGLEALTGPRDLAQARRLLAASSYQGEPVVAMSPADLPNVSAMASVGADVLARIAFKVDLQSMDWGTLIQRRSKDVAPAQGGWNVVFTSLNGSGIMDPVSHIGIRADGKAAWAGWPTSERLEQLRAEFVTTDDPDRQQELGRAIQAQFWIDVPYVPLGEVYGAAAFNRRVTDIPRGFPLFYGVRLG